MAVQNEYTKPEYYKNRELSWLQFNERILLEAKDKTNRLFERLKFLSITASNLDEFFMVRVASLKDMVDAKFTKPDLAGMKPKEQLVEILKETHEFMGRQYSAFNRSLLPLLDKEGLTILTAHEQMNEVQCKFVDDYFDETIYPILTPMAVDSARPFPLIRNKSLNICVLLKGKDEENYATVQVPAVVSRIVELPSDNGRTVILLEQIIERNIDKLFSNHKVICAYPYRITRNADLSIDEDDAADLLEEIQKQLKKRQRGEAIRLEIEDKCDKNIIKFLKRELNVGDESIYKISGPIDLTFLMKLYGMEGFEYLKDEKYIPVQSAMINDDEDIFTQISRNDILLHHPYESFDPVVDFVRQAANDENVLAIKQTLYRVSGNSPIIASLAKAADNGKQVTVLVELKARFDEENNIQWAKKLEKSGCHVIYGLMGLKTHSKITLVVRKEDEGIKRYVHLGTGNYNDATAKLYTDMGLLTCNEAIGEDATAVFNMISGYSEPKQWNKLSLAPYWLRDRFLYLIRREAMYAKEGRKAFITAKMNSLCDKEIIAALYEASSAGVEINLIVRGICCLKTGIPGISENIHVRSIVGTFLEHSRIFYFGNGGNEEVYMASADWMPRNLDKRVEILFPVEDERLKTEVINILNIQLADTLKAHILVGDQYEKVDKRGKELLSSQMYFCELAKDRKKKKNESKERLFVSREMKE
ncbi:RNA degradosome polyphosphate kinase [Bovifimicola ammoniilytica]|jgi:polyphosphate kinase|uniref:RNA degradosome polyphosphate kinase n=1 Tax=Bovifimicola ammoniilytica TaxID=2981720 RepID=UPI0008221538|nr:RNA degradosome polyphosphate kinase [Bovifimicola ammoniilytica]MCU6753724.1 RNA degradosome polyphosphate kinase [Bovifimicola ammoniilytica]SCJ71568.1 Polyphosphate kinase [uncultured Eubacterium sp.]